MSLLLHLLTSHFTLSLSLDTITPTQPLNDGQTLLSSSHTFQLGFFTSNNHRYVGIWYHNLPDRTYVWVANRDNPLIGVNGTLSIQSGNLVLHDNKSNIVWSTTSQTTTYNKPMARLLDNGNLVLSDGSWQSFDYPTDTMLPEMKLGWDRKTGLNRFITSWRSPDDPSTGDKLFKLDLHGSPQIMLYGNVDNRSNILYRAGPWNGLRFSGSPEISSFRVLALQFTLTPNEEAYYTYKVITNETKLTRLVVTPTGVVQWLVWMVKPKKWNQVWYAPKDPCSTYNKCGPNGVCNTSDINQCECLKGFEPKMAQDWKIRDWSDGCVRRTRVCGGGDGFVVVNGLKVPDTSGAVVDGEMGLRECETACLRNCSCAGYGAKDVREGVGGCVMWFGDLVDLRSYAEGGQDLYIRVSASEIDSTERAPGERTSAAAVILKEPPATVAVVVIVMLLLGASIYFILKRRINAKGLETGIQNDCNSDTGSTTSVKLPVYDLSTIQIATKNFSIANKIGEGGFGPVYKGKLGEDQYVAIKRLSRNSTQGLDEFKNEVSLIAKLQHRNLVRLLGCCVEGDERILIYEYMSNKSLDTFLFDTLKSIYLDWKMRRNIIIGIARGLVYLHQDSRYRIIHRDLKASNILLDDEMNPKISDFGTARLFGGDHGEANTERVVGTYGYMSPEYAMDGIFSVKSDVFSFGVLLLEIISGKKNRGIYQSQCQTNLLAQTWNLWKEESVLELLDPSMSYSSPISEVLRCIHVGLLCVQEQVEDRPTMPSVVMMLGSEAAVLPQPKQPGFLVARSHVQIDWSSSPIEELYSVNDISVSTIQAR